MRTKFFRGLLEENYHFMIALVSIFIGLCFVPIVNQSPKWAIYLFISPFFLALFYLYDNLYIRIATVAGLLIFAEKILVSQRQPVPFVTVGVSLVFLVTVLVSVLNFEVILKFLQQRILVVVLFVATPLISIAFSQGHGYGFFYEQILTYQIYYIEFFLFLLLGFLVHQAE